MEKMSFFERLTGSVKVADSELETHHRAHVSEVASKKIPQQEIAMEDEEGQLTVDMWQNQNEILIQAIVGGIKPEDLDVSISHDMVTIRGKREKSKEISGTDYFYQELYWGSFSRSILLPQEIDTEESEATIKHGLLTIKLPKLDKAKIQKLRVKNE